MDLRRKALNKSITVFFWSSERSQDEQVFLNSIKKNNCECFNPDDSTIDSTAASLYHYFYGNGKPVRLGENTRLTFEGTTEYYFIIGRLIGGLANEKSFEGVAVDFTQYMFHVGNTNFNYKTVCNETTCTTTFTVGVNDGFKDPFDLEDHPNINDYLKEIDCDFRVPKEVGKPYEYIPFEFDKSYPNPGYGTGEID